MKRALTPVRLLLVLLAAGALSGCFQSLVLLKVNKDGSGTLEETMLLTDAFSQMIATLSGQEADGGQSQDVDEARLREKAQAMGEGVRLVSAEPVKDDKGAGYRAVYSFPDVNKIRVNQQPSAGLPTVPGADGQQQEPSVEDWLQFRFQKGATSTLEVVFPQPEDDQGEQTEESEEQEGQEQDSPEMMDMVRQLYSDMRIRIAVEVSGRIADTNARYVEGSRVTLVDVDFGKLLEDEARFQELLHADPKSIEELEQLIGDNPALRMETQPLVRIRFN